MATRRAVLTTAGASLLAGCWTLPDDSGAGGGGKPPVAIQLIDAHCHLFNVKDLSAVRFIAYTILKQYPDAGRLLAAGAGLTEPDDPTFLDRVIRVLLNLVGAWRAPSARTELAYLTRRTAALAAVADEDRLPVDEDTQRRALINDATAFLGGTSQTGDAEAEATVRGLILQAAGEAIDMEPQVLFARPEAERRALVERAFTVNEEEDLDEGPAASLVGPPFYLPGLIDFIVQLKRYRHQLVGELARRHARQGQTPALLVPAMVDFGRWLRDDPPPSSSLSEQVAVWGEISRRRRGPAVHGYVGFCPLRQVLHERANAPGESPLGLVERALDTEGFLGVKLYPPMGFSATRNGERTEADPPVSHEVLELVFGAIPSGEVEEKTRELGRALDEALHGLYRLCEAPGRRAAILAHGGNSVGAGRRSGELADPYYWKGVFDRADGPAVMLAHFGGFIDVSADPAKPPAPSPLPQGWRAPAFEHTWEAWLGRYIQANPCKPVFADISMLTDVLPGGPRARSEAGFKRLAAEVPGIVDHLVFGTDWTMLAQARGAPRYDIRVIAFLRDVFRTDTDRALEKILRGNFLRYAGLVEGAPAYDRVRRVYRGDRQLNDRLRAACLPVAPVGITPCLSRSTP